MLAGVVSALPLLGNAAAPPMAPPAAVLTSSWVRAMASTAKPETDIALRSRLRSAVLGAAAGTAWDAECEQDNQASGAAAGVARQRLPDGTWLLRLDCGAGAYQGSFWAAQVWRQAGQWRAGVLVWRVAQAQARVGGGATGQPFTLTQEVVLSGDLALLPGGTVEVLNRFRGLGDCGTRSAYEVKQGRVRFMVLAAVWVCPDTPASVPIGPPDWPILKSFGR